MQHNHERASKTYAACTVAPVHQYITLTVHVICHWRMAKLLGIRRATGVEGEVGGGKTLHPRGEIWVVYLVCSVCLVCRLSGTNQSNQIDQIDETDQSV